MSPPDLPWQLLTLAERDYRAALILARAEEPQTDAAGFHLQQSVEKALKAWLGAKGVDFPRTHDLSVLLGLLEDRDQEVKPYWPLLELNPFAVQFRYELPSEDFPDFDELAVLAKKLLSYVQSII